MVKINKRLLPIKAHYFFFMAAMGPILPQLPVMGKQLGVSPEIMGYITSVLPIMYVLAKPLFGFVADYFVRLRKYIFLLLIVFMTIAFGAFHFIPNGQNETMDLFPSTLNPHFEVNDAKECSPLMMNSSALSNTAVWIREANCSTLDSLIFTAFLTETNANSSKALNLSSNADRPLFLSMCLPPNAKQLFLNQSKFGINSINASCIVKSQEQPNNIYRTWTFWLFVTLMCAGTIGFNVVNSISDAICFDLLGESEEGKYGAQRVWGTIGFGVTALLAGILVNLWTNDIVKSFTPALLIMFVFSGLDIFSVSKLKLPKLTSSESILKSVWELIAKPEIRIFLVFATIAGIIDSFVIYFLFWHMEEVAAETGYMDQIKLIEGCVVAAECIASEVPVFFYSGKIIKKLGYVHCMSLCFFFYAIRLALIAWIPNPWYLVAVELFFQGCTYALCYTVIVAYAAAVAPPGTSATVQGLMAGMDDGLGFSIGSLIGGQAFKAFGGRRSFSYFAILAICTCVAHIVLRPRSRNEQYLPKGGYQPPKDQLETGAVLNISTVN